MSTAHKYKYFPAANNIFWHQSCDAHDLIQRVEWESQYSVTEQGHFALTDVHHDEFVCSSDGISLVSKPRTPHPVVSVYFDTQAHDLNALFEGQGVDFRFRYSGGGFPDQAGIKVHLAALFPDFKRLTASAKDLSAAMVGRVEHEEAVNPKHFDPSVYPLAIKYTYLRNRIRNAVKDKPIEPRFVVASKRKLLMFNVAVPARDEVVNVGLEVSLDKYRYYELPPNRKVYVANPAESERAIVRDQNNVNVKDIRGRFLKIAYGLEVEYKPEVSDANVRSRHILHAEKLIMKRAHAILCSRFKETSPDAMILQDPQSKAKKGFAFLQAGIK
ncbi:MAG: hypothetical protein PHY92_10600 [Alphaproteobacteria bacterium]|nr:hypothetical protein [Alphaproteobacteria bacterium]